MRRRICDLYQPRPRGSDGRQRPLALVRLGQSAQGRRAQRRPDRRIARPPPSPEGGVTIELLPFARDVDPQGFAAELAPGFGGDEGPAREVLAETIALLTSDPRPIPWGAYVVQSEGRPIGIAFGIG